MRSPLTESIKRVQGMVSYVQENLSTEEYDLFLDTVAPEPERQEAKPKKTRKKRRGLASATTTAPREEAKRESAANNDGWCTAPKCGQPSSNPIHDKSMGYGDYHEFQAPKKEKSAA